MKFEMKTKALRFLSDIQTGPFGSQLHKEDYVDDGTPIVTVEHLGNRVFTEQNLPRVSNEDKQRLSKYILKEGDIVFSRVGSVDRCSFVDSQHTGWLFSGRCLRVRPFEEISPLFLYYFFCLESTKKFMRNIAVGATMPSINTKLMGEIEVSYPDKQVQEKIANLLGAIDDKIELNNAINDNLAVLKFDGGYIQFAGHQFGQKRIPDFSKFDIFVFVYPNLLKNRGNSFRKSAHYCFVRNDDLCFAKIRDSELLLSCSRSGNVKLTQVQI